MPMKKYGPRAKFPKPADAFEHLRDCELEHCDECPVCQRVMDALFSAAGKVAIADIYGLPNGGWSLSERSREGIELMRRVMGGIACD